MNAQQNNESAYLTEGAMEDQGVLPFDFLNQIGELIRKAVARKVQRSGYMPIETPLVVPAAHLRNPQFKPKFIQPKSQSSTRK